MAKTGVPAPAVDSDDEALDEPAEDSAEAFADDAPDLVEEAEEAMSEISSLGEAATDDTAAAASDAAADSFAVMESIRAKRELSTDVGKENEPVCVLSEVVASVFNWLE